MLCNERFYYRVSELENVLYIHQYHQVKTNI